MKQIIIFSRTSTIGQDVEQQTSDLIREAKRLGYSEKNQVIVEYQESAIKLDVDTRIGIRKLKETINENKNIDCVICWELTRIARRADVIYNIRDFLQEHKIRWVVCKPFMEILNKEGKMTEVSSLMLGIFSSFAESEMLIKTERFKRARDEMKARGQKSTGATIFGYVKNSEKKMEPHPKNSLIIRAIFDHYKTDDDASLFTTYKWAMGKWPEVFPVQEYKKAQRKIKRILSCEIYWKGNWCYPAIIDEATANIVRTKAENAKCKPRFMSKYDWLGRGKVYCAHCGRMMTLTGGVTKAYTCPTDKLHNMTINTDVIEWLIWEEARVAMNIKANINRNDIIIETEKKISEKKNLLANYQIEIENLKSKQEKLVELYLENKISKNIFDNKNSEIECTLHAVESNVENVNIELLDLNNVIEKSQGQAQQKSINYDSIDSFEERLAIVKETIAKIWCTKLESKVYYLVFEYNNVITPQIGKYKYIAKNQFKKLYRINADETVDFIYCEGQSKHGADGKFVKLS